ncbi:uncharacterized protein LOC124152925 [Haliotis rufescens]|uniref:uncharacterized protein LOC124152925 n=1 Tax=Haliotis rufescens TaxID=6454 RepID=UPI001EB046C7|nr:uncharacterized protein LOC124152925 [Haliotis rufescens]XP_048238227.1 uncharacterized protein LOC124152925 [Haliotis rufescens]
MRFLLLVALAALFLVVSADFLQLLKHITHQDYFHKLPAGDQVILVELVAEGEIGRLSEYIHKVGPQRIRQIANSLPQHEEQLLVHYIQQHVHHPNTTAST